MKRLCIACIILASAHHAVAASDAARSERIRKLASESYAERVEATRQLWAEGESAKEDLLEAARSRDPEVVMRARDLLRKIDLGIDPDTDPKIIQLTDNYRRANPTEKNTIYSELRRLRAWRQILRLYAAEKDDNLRTTLARMIDSIALLAARERIAVGDMDGALDYLEMARATENGLMAIAAFHRARGTLKDEIRALGDPAEKHQSPWLTALHRASGNAKEAARYARLSGNEPVAAVMDMLMGNPLPWLDYAAAQDGRNEDAAVARYARAAAARWRGEAWTAERNSIRRQLRSPDDGTRLSGISHLFLLGDVEPAWQQFSAHHPEEAFASFDALELVDEALEVAGAGSDLPALKNHLAEMLAKICVPPGKALDDDETRDAQLGKFIMFCGFLERRGMAGLLDESVIPNVLEFSKTHEPRFIDLMSELFGLPASRTAAPELAFRVATKWAVDDAERWSQMVIAAFGEENEYARWWELLGRVDGDAAHAERMQAMLAIFGYTRDSEGLYEPWIDAIWKHANEHEQDRELVTQSMEFLASSVTDIGLIQTLRFARDGSLRGEEESETADVNLLVDAALGHWGKIADVFLQQIGLLAQRGDARAELHAYAAVSLRNAGRIDDAEAHELWVESLALGDSRTNLAVAQAFAFGRDYDRAYRWYRRAVMESSPTENRFQQALLGFCNELLERREHALAASCGEVLAQWESKESNYGFTPSLLIRLRQQADFSRALSLPADQRSESYELLRAAHAMAPTDGSLADHFFPSLLETPHRDLHKELFEISWRKITANLIRFPDADNTMNTAVWFASRAAQRLDEAKVMQERALELYPRSAAYLDTLAEVYFAMGNRPEAVRLGELALRYIPHDSMIIRQYERFVHGRMPVP